MKKLLLFIAAAVFAASAVLPLRFIFPMALTAMVHRFGAATLIQFLGAEKKWLQLKVLMAGIKWT